MSTPSHWPEKHCVICGIRLERKERSDGGKEHIGEFLRRKTCSALCYSKFATGRKHPLSIEKKSAFRDAATRRMIGRRFGNLTVMERSEDYCSPRGQSHATYKCKCDCGNIVVCRGYMLRSGHYVTCKECSRKRAAAAVTKHGFSKKDPLYTTWKGMRERCNNPNGIHHDIYHDKGIRVCEEWNDYVRFREWALSHGWKHGLTIDRIDSNKGYSPANCRVVTMKVNNENRVIGRDKVNGRYVSVR